MSKALKKNVLAYCVRGDQLPVFRHVDCSWKEVGVQVPAGSIREGDAVEGAALGELREETGYACFEINGVIGTTWYDISPYREELQEIHGAQIVQVEHDGHAASLAKASIGEANSLASTNCVGAVW